MGWELWFAALLGAIVGLVLALNAMRRAMLRRHAAQVDAMTAVAFERHWTLCPVCIEAAHPEWSRAETRTRLRAAIEADRALRRHS